jgi:uncharacterized protein YPO0396
MSDEIRDAEGRILSGGQDASAGVLFRAQFIALNESRERLQKRYDERGMMLRKMEAENASLRELQEQVRKLLAPMMEAEKQKRLDLQAQVDKLHKQRLDVPLADLMAPFEVK